MMLERTAGEAIAIAVPLRLPLRSQSYKIVLVHGLKEGFLLHFRRSKWRIFGDKRATSRDSTGDVT